MRGLTSGAGLKVFLKIITSSKESIIKVVLTSQLKSSFGGIF